MRYFNLLLAFLTAISGFYLIWKFTQPELNGHWHIVEGGEHGSPPITALRIDPNGKVIISQPGADAGPGFGELNRFRYEVRLGGPAHASYFDVSWSGDTLLLSEMHPRHFHINEHQLTGRVMKGVR